MIIPSTPYNINITYDTASDYHVYSDITTEIWNRILNNLPYLYKSKGTIRGLKALVNCYGIPASLLTITEYSGPDLDPTNHVYSEYAMDNYSYAVKFNSNQTISFDWSKSSYDRFPSSIQFRFLLPPSAYNTSFSSMSLAQVNNKWSVSIIPGDTTYYGKLKFSILTGSNSYDYITTSEFDMYDGQFNFVTLQREYIDDSQINQTYSLIIKKYKNSLIETITESIFVESSSINSWAVPETFVLGGTNFNGAIDELRFWDTPLINSVLDTHVKFPQSIISNYMTSSFSDLVLRISFDNPVTFDTGSLPIPLINEASQTSLYSLNNLELIGWTNTTLYPYNYQFYQYPSSVRPVNIGSTRISSNKIRIENTTIPNNTLEIGRSVEQGQYDFYHYDNAKLGLNFSPVELLNENIVKTIAIESSDDLIGNPADLYNDTYSELEIFKKYYFLTYPNSGTIKDYINYIRFYDNSLFEHIKQFIPARTKLTVGVVYEPNVLERIKYRYKKPYMSVDDGSISINLNEQYKDLILTGEYDSLEIILSNNIISNISSNIDIYNSSIQTQFNSTNVLNFSIDNIYNILSLNNMAASFNSSLDKVIGPIVDFDTNRLVWGQYYRTKIQDYSFTSGYSDRHYKNFLGYNTVEQRQKYIGCIQNKTTTLDLREPVEIWSVDNKILIKNDNGITKLETI